MSFTQSQSEALAGPLSASKVKTRSQSGRNLSYIEGWWAIHEANRIFGFDGWTRETIRLDCVAEHERPIGKQGDKGWGMTYIARVRIVACGIAREGCGTGHGIDRDKGKAHESALKEAETDAMKRALMTFGNPFGLALYDKEQNGVTDDTKPSTPTNGNGHMQTMQQDEDVEAGVRNWCAVQKAALSRCETVEAVQDWEEARKDALDRLRRKALPAWSELMRLKEARIGNLNLQ